jgi:UDP-N-acetylglucosamine--N-acetylmuramyl-(pentapeptide) pyrophosphoryl-undecaprenol N-acetylglucosamine transferase
MFPTSHAEPSRVASVSVSMRRGEQHVPTMTRLLIASTGGHLTELVLLAPRLSPPAQDELWVTFDSKQSRTLLGDRDVRFIRDTPPRDWRGVMANAAVARGMLKHLAVETVVSNGAGVALSFLPLAYAKGVPAHYIECSARTEGPSVTGRILQQLRGVNLYTQHRELENAKWRYAGSVFDSYEAVEVATPPSLQKVVITIGTLDFSFRRLFDRLKALLPVHVDVVVQAGPDSSRIDWPGARVEALMAPDELGSLMERADVVVAHAGIGSALMAFEAGKSPILIPRMKSHGEHVDDHQTQIAQQFADRGLAVMADASAVGLEHFSEALARCVKRAPKRQDFSLL